MTINKKSTMSYYDIFFWLNMICWQISGWWFRFWFSTSGGIPYRWKFCIQLRIWNGHTWYQRWQV